MSDAADKKMIPASSERSAAQTNTAETYHPTRRCEGCGERRPKHELLRAARYKLQGAIERRIHLPL